MFGGNRLWKQSPNGKITDAIPWVEGFQQFGGSNFVVDAAENIYFPFQNLIYKRIPSGEVSLLSDFTFGRLCTMTSDNVGNILVSDSHEDGKLFRINRQGEVSLIAENLKELNPEDPPLKEKRFNLFYGITPHADKIYLTNSGSRRILAIEADGSFSEYFKSEAPWYPVGICFHKDQVLILEWGFSHTNIGPRILRANEEGGFKEIYNHETKVVSFSMLENRPVINNWWYWIAGALLLILLFVKPPRFVKSRRFD